MVHFNRSVGELARPRKQENDAVRQCAAHHRTGAGSDCHRQVWVGSQRPYLVGATQNKCNPLHTADSNSIGEEQVFINSVVLYTSTSQPQCMIAAVSMHL